MTLTRRTILRSALAAPAVLTLPAQAAMTAPEGEQNAGWYRFALGSFEITVVSDGNLLVPTTTIGTNQPREAVTSFLEDRFLDPATNYSHTNLVLIDTGDAKVLIDVGSGDKFQPSAGRVVANLEAAGIDIGDVTHVALTHAHPDHVWGMMDDFGDEPRFPEAEYSIAAAEFDWWMTEGRVDLVPEMIQGFVVGAQNALRPVAERTTMVKGNDQIVPGVTMIDTPGHTPGHMSVMIESEGQSMMVLGDAITHAYASFEHPDWQFVTDIDPDMAVKTRKQLLDRLATDRIAVVGYHLPFPGVGHVLRRGSAYQYVAAPWQWGDG